MAAAKWLAECWRLIAGTAILLLWCWVHHLWNLGIPAGALIGLAWGAEIGIQAQRRRDSSTPVGAHRR